MGLVLVSIQGLAIAACVFVRRESALFWLGAAAACLFLEHGAERFWLGATVVALALTCCSSGVALLLVPYADRSRLARGPPAAQPRCGMETHQSRRDLERNRIRGTVTP